MKDPRVRPTADGWRGITPPPTTHRCSIAGFQVHSAKREWIGLRGSACCVHGFPTRQGERIRFRHRSFLELNPKEMVIPHRDNAMVAMVHLYERY